MITVITFPLVSEVSVTQGDSGTLVAVSVRPAHDVSHDMGSGNDLANKAVATAEIEMEYRVALFNRYAAEECTCSDMLSKHEHVTSAHRTAMLQFFTG